MLFTRFGRNGLPVDLFNSLPPLGNLAKSCVSCASMAHQPAPNHGTSSANSAPTVEVHGLAVTNSGVDGVEDPRHLPGIAGNAMVDNRMPLISNGGAKATDFFLRNLNIWDQFSRLRQVDEVVNPRTEQGSQLSCGLCRVLRARKLSRREAAGGNSVAIG